MTAYSEKQDSFDRQRALRLQTDTFGATLRELVANRTLPVKGIAPGMLEKGWIKPIGAWHAQHAPMLAAAGTSRAWWVAAKQATPAGVLKGKAAA